MLKLFYKKKTSRKLNSRLRACVLNITSIFDNLINLVTLDSIGSNLTSKTLYYQMRYRYWKKPE